MKEVELKNETKIEISVKQKKHIEHQLIDKIIPHNGHTLWRINKETLEIDKAKFANATYHVGRENNKEIIINDGYAYISALTKKTALDKYKKGLNGTKKIENEPLKLNAY